MKKKQIFMIIYETVLPVVLFHCCRLYLKIIVDADSEVNM